MQPRPKRPNWVITITATSPDRTAESKIEHIALRTDESEQEAT